MQHRRMPYPVLSRCAHSDPLSLMFRFSLDVSCLLLAACAGVVLLGSGCRSAHTVTERPGAAAVDSARFVGARSGAVRPAPSGRRAAPVVLDSSEGSDSSATASLPAAPPDSAAASASPPKGLWIDLGLGTGTLGAGGHVQLSARSNRSLFTLRFAGTEETNLLGPSTSAADVGFLYGRTADLEDDWALASMSLGVGIVRSASPQEGNGLSGRSNETFTLGIPLSARLGAQLPFAGLGVQIFGNLNPKQSFAGLVVSVQLGAMR